MKKLKLYLDTSVISYLDAQDTPEKMTDTLALWQDMEAGKYEVSISDIAMEELAQCSEPKKTLLLEHISTIEVLQIRENHRIFRISQYLYTIWCVKRKKQSRLQTYSHRYYCRNGLYCKLEF